MRTIIADLGLAAVVAALALGLRWADLWRVAPGTIPGDPDYIAAVL
jgi:hypothetical protein